MPRLRAGGKWVFGWAMVGAQREITLPPEACLEYQLLPGAEVAFTMGSRTSGGFGIGRCANIRGNPPISRRILATGKMGDGGRIYLPPEVGLEPRARLLMVRGSGIALGLLRRGPLYERAKGHSEIKVFG